MRIRMTRLAAGPEGVCRPGREYEVSRERCRALGAAGAAVEVAAGVRVMAALTDLDGIGPARAELLAELGFESPADLSRATQKDVKVIADAARGVGLETVQEWVREAERWR